MSVCGYCCACFFKDNDYTDRRDGEVPEWVYCNGWKALLSWIGAHVKAKAIAVKVIGIQWRSCSTSYTSLGEDEDPVENPFPLIPNIELLRGRFSLGRVDVQALEMRMAWTILI